MKKYLKNIVQECLKKAKSKNLYFSITIVSFILLFSITACSVNTASKEWIAKHEDLTIPADVYLYYLYQAYQDGRRYVWPDGKDIFSQKIEGKAAEEWMKETAINNVKAYILINKSFKEQNLQVHNYLWDPREDTEMAWNDDKWQFRRCGITKNAVRLGDVDFRNKKSAVSAHLKFDPERESPSLVEFFESEYIDFNLITKKLYYPVANQPKITPFSAEERKKSIKEFEGYAQEISTKTATVEKIQKRIQEIQSNQEESSVKPLYEISHSLYAPRNSNLYLYVFGAPSSESVLIKNMKSGEAKVMLWRDLTGGECIDIYVKNDHTGKSEAELKALEEVDVINDRYDYLENQYYQKMTKELTGVKVNEEVFNKYSPKMFEKSKK